ncbi:14084_t:CDS:2, partial [Funneliformis geosporum]
ALFSRKNILYASAFCSFSPNDWAIFSILVLRLFKAFSVVSVLNMPTNSKDIREASHFHH